MSKGEWTGWKRWNDFKNAGIVENAVDFSDEAIITDHAVGRTKDAIDMCWPMDAAVAYTLMKVGPDVELSKVDMVNTFTRSAAVMMTGKVAYGEFPKPGVESCGHDEVIAHIHTLAGLKVVGAHESSTAEAPVIQLKFDTSYYNKKSMSQFLKQQDVEEGDPLFDLCTVRTNTDIHQLTTEHFMTWEYFRPLREFISDQFGNGGAFVIEHSDDIDKSRSFTRGKCKWHDDPNKKCKHHDQPMIHNWGMVRTADGFDTIWHRERTYAGWNWNQFNDYAFDTPEKISGTVLWSEVSRSLSNAIDEKQVVRYISKSLQRMLKRSDNIVAKHGEGRSATFSWSDWSWLADLTSQIKGTNSKKRKENEIANGWIYTKVNSRMSFGHEIADFVWRPADEIFEYGVKVTGWKADGRYSWDTTASAPMAGLRFASSEQAKAFIVAIRSAHLEHGGFMSARSHTGLEKNLLDSGQNGVSFSVVKYNMQGNYELAGVYHPEEYMHPAQLHMMYRNAAPAVIAPHDEKLTKSPTKGGPYLVVEVAPPEEEK